MSEPYYGTRFTETQNQRADLENCWYLEIFLISESSLFYVNVNNLGNGIPY
jgi:hypothetical protein